MNVVVGGVGSPRVFGENDRSDRVEGRNWGLYRVRRAFCDGTRVLFVSGVLLGLA
ncbi:hypothetical protein [Pasteuria penetrans]|uniref:hypothetical protein n=1 Tax=Pasteuria penetrans TaxID=86005 RepID=UPI00165BE13B|nr:hypothetical protein [Pasteuria penetrans]